jgi:protease-4
LGGCGDDDDEEPASEGDGVAEVREIVIESPPAEDGSSAFLGSQEATLGDVLRRLRAVARDDDAKGLLLHVGPMSGAWGRALEIADAAKAVHDAGKPVHCHFTFADNLSYALMARVCDRISMTPAGDLDLVGLAAHLFYMKTLLANLGVRADLLQVGAYKGTAEPFTLDAPSEETRAQMNQLLDDLTAWIVTSVAEGRDLPEDRVRALVDEGPFDAWTATERGLVDDVGFDDEAMEHARVAADAERVRRVPLTPRPEPVGLADILDAFSGETPHAAPEGDRIGLVYLVGQITEGDEGGGTDEGGRSGPFVRAMRSFADDDEIKALVIRIDSPGGSALASDRMWHAVRRVAKKKPVIVSVGDMCASGGYYIASAATEIYVDETSLVGSIGVVGGKVVVDELAARVGVHTEIIERGRHAAYASPTRPFTDEERAVLERMMRQTYERFLRRIETGREMERAAILPHAEGRVMTGKRALDAGLVDRVGGLSDALAHAREQAGLPEDAPVERWPRRKTFLDAIAEGMGGAEPGDRARALMEDAMAAAGPMGEATRILPLFAGRERVAVTMPFVLHVE